MTESDLASVATERVVEAVAGVAPTAAGIVGEDGAAAEEETVPRRAELWWVLLLLAGLVLGAESVLANRWTRRRPVSGLAGA